MHSSRMRTTRLLAVSPSMHCTGGGLLLEGWVGLPLVLMVSASDLWGCLPLVLGDVSQHSMGQTPPSVDRILDTHF